MTKQFNFILSSLLLLSAHYSNATIVYTDIIDATLTAEQTIEINFDGTGVSEFSITDNSFGGPVEPGLFFTADHGFIMAGDFPAGGWDVIKGLPLGTTIDGTGNFANNGADGYIDPFWATYTFPTSEDQYIGATFKLGTNVHYGWIRVNWDGAGTLVVKDFAYNDVPNTSIDAGDNETSTASIIPNNTLTMETYPNPASNVLTIEHNTSTSGTGQLIDLKGKVMTSFTMDSPQKEIFLSEIPTGTYQLILNLTNGTVFHQTIVKQ